jgi:hypothetical protein
MAEARNNANGKIVLELGGVVAGFLREVSGGEAYRVVDHSPGPNGIPLKRAGAIKYEPLQISFSSGMSKPFYQWVVDFVGGTASPKSGAIVYIDFNGKELSRLVFEGALISQFEIPALSGASRESGYFSLTLVPKATHFTKEKMGAALPDFTQAAVKPFLLSNYRLKIAGLETACSRIAAIDAITLTQPISVPEIGQPAATGSRFINEFKIQLPETQADGFLDWFSAAVNQSSTRTCTLDILDQTMVTVLFTITSPALGILSYSRGGIQGDAIPSAYAQFFCNELSFSFASDSVSIGIPAPDPKSPAAFTKTLADGILNIMNERLRQQDLMINAQRSVSLEEFDGSASVSASPVMIARRLQATQQADPVPAAALRDAGVAAGANWAADKASLDELKQIAALDNAGWTGIRLSSDNSLAAHLVEAGVIQSTGNGQLELKRSGYLEGIVAGAAQVLRSAAPHLDPPAV